MNNRILDEDVQLFAEQFELWEQLKGKAFLITGATGLIGSVMVKCLQALNSYRNLGIKIFMAVRDVEKAKKIISGNPKGIEIVKIDLMTLTSENLPKEINYVVHLASPTNGKYIDSHPVETFNLAYQSTKNLLAEAGNYDAFLYVSSLEYYGQVLDDRLITEDTQGYINPNVARNAYPLGKRAAEFLCFLYAEEFGASAKIARLTQTFGPGISKDENRVFAQFVRSIVKGEDIVLHTQGTSSKPYCYTTDCISALLYILLRGQKGQAYNVANESTYISIRNMAEYLKQNFNPKISVQVELNDNMGYAPVTMLRLSSEKLRNLGWRPRYGLKEMFERLIGYLNE